MCRCGNVGCLEAVAGGRRWPSGWPREGADAANSRDVVRLVRAGRRGRHAHGARGRPTLGEVLAGTRELLQPGGDRHRRRHRRGAGAAARRRPRGRSSAARCALATRDLRIVPCRLGDRAGVIGAAIMVIDRVLAPEAIDRALERDVGAGLGRRDARHGAGGRRAAELAGALPHAIVDPATPTLRDAVDAPAGCSSSSMRGSWSRSPPSLATCSRTVARRRIG